MSTSDTLYTARFELADLLELGKANALQCRVYRAGRLVAPTAGTITIYDASNTALVSAAAATISSSIATYSLLAATIASSSLGEGWRIEWSLTMPDGEVHVFRNDAALVRRRLYPVVTELDLYRVESSLDPRKDGVIHSENAFVDKLDEAFIQMENRLIERRNRPNLILSPSSLREVHLYWTLALIFEDFATPLNPGFAEKAKTHRENLRDAWNRIRWAEDAYDTGADPQPGARKSGANTMWLTSRG